MATKPAKAAAKKPAAKKAPAKQAAKKPPVKKPSPKPAPAKDDELAKPPVKKKPTSKKPVPASPDEVSKDDFLNKIVSGVANAIKASPPKKEVQKVPDVLMVKDPVFQREEGTDLDRETKPVPLGTTALSLRTNKVPNNETRIHPPADAGKTSMSEIARNDKRSKGKGETRKGTGFNFKYR